MAEVDPSQVDVVVLNWRTAEMSAECAHVAARALPGAAIYLVDNGSGDGSPDRLKALAPHATLIETGRNLGFGAGMNAGILAGKRPYVLILNSDARPKGDALQQMLQLCASDPRIGVVTPMTIDGQDRPVPQLPPEPPAWKLVVGVMPLVSKLIRGPMYVPEAGPPLSIDWMPALCAVMFRREALEKIGGFDPNYFLGWEEWDIARRIQQAGYGIRLHRTAEIIHTGLGSTPKRLSKWRAMHGRHSLCHHLRKYHGTRWYLAGRVACGIAALRHQLPIRPT